MGLFSKPKTPTIDTGALTRIAQDNEAKQKAIVGGLRPNLQPLNTAFETKRNEIGNNLTNGTENILTRYGQDLSQVGAADTAARTAANAGFRESSFRDVPELQRSIRESLGGSGSLGNAAALSALSRPILDANRTSRDFEVNNTVAGLNAQAGRSEKLADTGYTGRSDALKGKLGLDEGTIQYLTETGRGDLIKEANDLLGIEDQAGANRLGTEQARQASEMAKAAASNARRGQILTSLGSVAGAGLGAMTGNPMAIGLGSQLGSSLGNMAGGGGGAQFDPTLLYAMAQQRRGAVQGSLSNPTTDRFAAQYRTGGY